MPRPGRRRQGRSPGTPGPTLAGGARHQRCSRRRHHRPRRLGLARAVRPGAAATSSRSPRARLA
eukprot:3336328-Alexandrium_andersonii.AAC.1